MPHECVLCGALYVPRGAADAERERHARRALALDERVLVLYTVAHALSTSKEAECAESM